MGDGGTVPRPPQLRRADKEHPRDEADEQTSRTRPRTKPALVHVHVLVTTDQDADFTRFVDARWPRLVRFAHLLTGDFHEAEDLVQTTLVKVCARWRHLPAA